MFYPAKIMFHVKHLTPRIKTRQKIKPYIPYHLGKNRKNFCHFNALRENDDIFWAGIFSLILSEKYTNLSKTTSISNFKIQKQKRFVNHTKQGFNT